MKRFIAVWILLSAGLNIWQMGRITKLFVVTQTNYESLKIGDEVIL